MYQHHRCGRHHVEWYSSGSIWYYKTYPEREGWQGRREFHVEVLRFILWRDWCIGNQEKHNRQILGSYFRNGCIMLIGTGFLIYLFYSYKNYRPFIKLVHLTLNSW